MRHVLLILSTNWLDAFFKSLDFQLRNFRLFSPIFSGKAAVEARWEMTGAKNRESQNITLRMGLLNFVMTKEGGKWSITVMHNMDLPSTP